MLYFVSRLFPYFLLFLIIQTSTRIALLINESQNIDFSIGNFLKVFTSGLVYDTATFSYMLIPIVFLLWLLRLEKLKKFNRIATSVTIFVFTYILLFNAIAEWLFWDEFSSRFNFIAVDYLIYRDEVIGNIKESYPLWQLLLGIGLCSTLPLFFLQKFSPTANSNHAGLRFLTLLILPASFFIGLPERSFEVSDNRYLNEVAKNGIYELFAAFRSNELSYDAFYLTRNSEDLMPVLRLNLEANEETFIDNGITRKISAPGIEKHHNVILITVESLSAEFLGTFGNEHGLTPYLDELASESLFFTNLYATGTRTAYGLAAITLSIPSIPGNSIVRRPENEKLFSLGAVLNSRGYDSKFIYGGYGYFDNMNYFFENNGYKIIDRSQLKKEEITFANIWGVCDEDVYNRTLKESDESYQNGKPFFQMIMTTSNHRPYTYPDGKIDIPSHTGRHGGVKYTDYAIGNFIEQAKVKPWFDNTIFVIVADHTAGSDGKAELEPAKYHIPLFIYAPKIVTAQTIDLLSSQIDVAPTVLALMNFSYTSKFYGKDILHSANERAFISNYQKLGYMTPDKLTILKPIKEVSYYQRKNRVQTEPTSHDDDLHSAALAYYQNASKWRSLNEAVEYLANQD